MLEFFDHLQGIVILLFGIYGLLLSYRVLPRKPKDPERTELWHRKYGRIIRILSPIVIVFGTLLVLGIL